MKDPEFARLVAEAMGPFPRGLGGEEIEGIDLVLLDDCIMGVASWYERNSRPVSSEHREMLSSCLRDLDAIWDALPSDEARSSFSKTRAVGEYLLEVRPAAPDEPASEQQ
jgi:hypothetical protein